MTIYSYYADTYLEPNVGATGAEVTEPGTDLNGVVTASFIEPDEQTRLELLAQAQEIVIRDALRIVVFDNVNSESGYFAAAPELHGLRSNTLSELVIADAWLEE